jgi:hypothetical protein
LSAASGGMEGRSVNQAPRVAGALCAVLSFVPIWYGLAAIARSDYFGALLALILAWVLARTGVELAAMGDDGAGIDRLGDLSSDRESGT